MFFVWDIQASQLTSSLRLALLMELHWYNKRKASMFNSIVKGPPYSVFYPIPCRIHRHRVGFALPCTKAQVWPAFFHIPCRIHRRLSFWTHTIHLFAISNAQYLPRNQKSVRTHTLRAQQCKIANQSFPFMKTQGPDRRCGISGLNQEFSTHTLTHTDHCHTENVATHHTICKWWWSCPTTRLEFWPQAVTTFKPWTSQTR